MNLLVPKETSIHSGARDSAIRVSTTQTRSLEGVPELVNLPLMGTRPAVREYRLALSAIGLPVNLFDELACANIVSTATVWQGVWFAFLHRYTQASPLLVGCPSSKRAAWASWLRIDVDGESTLLELVSDIARCTNSRSEECIETLERLRAGVDPLFHAGFFYNDEANALSPAKWWTYSDVTLVCRRLEPTALELAYNDRLILPETASRMAEHFATFVRHAFRAPDLPIRELELLSAEERARITVSWNQTSDLVPPGRSLPERLEELAQTCADTPAVVFGQDTLSFAQLNAQANRLARHLLSRGLELGGRVALCLERSLESVVAQMAIVKAGGAVLFLDPEQPMPRILGLVRESGARLGVARTALLDLLGSSGVEVICIDRDSQRIAAHSEENLGLASISDSPVLAAGTSGSTGEPKVVLCRHRALENAIHWVQGEYGVTPGDRATWLSSPGYGISQLEWWSLLAAGATIHVAEHGVSGSPEALRDWLVAHAISYTLIMTPMAVRLWALEWPEQSKLAVMQVAGERLRSWPPDNLPYEVVNVYGSAEATLVATCRVTRGPRSIAAGDRVDRLPPVGRPVSNVRTYILDAYQNPVPAGVVGELYIAGESLALGYTDSELSARKFCSIALPEEPSSFVYRTGDLARYWSNGVIDICGRSDGQVKIRGSRVELGEIEKRLAGLAGVEQVVVVDKEGLSGDKRLIAYVVPSPARPAAHQLRTALAAELPNYMLPSAFVFLDALPLLPSGKINRKALPAPPRVRPDLQTSWVAPRGPIERTVADLWSQLLQVDELGADDEFFELGGDSMLALSLLNAIKERFGVSVSVGDFFKRPTIRGVAEGIESAIAAGHFRQTATIETPKLQHDASSRYLPFGLSDMQQALHVGRGAEVELGSVGCHAYFEYDSQDLDVAKLQLAWNRIIARHDMLRAVFDTGNAQRVLSSVPEYQIAVEDVRRESMEEANRVLESTRERMSHQVLPSDRWPLFELRVLQLPDRTRLFVSLDLLVLDAWSYFQILMPELIELYEDPARLLPELSITFRDYIVKTQEALETTAEFQRAKQYWLERLPTLPPAVTLPQVTPPSGSEIKFVSRTHVIEKSRWLRMKEQGRRLGVTPSVVVVAAFAEVLRCWSGSDEFTINFPIFDRLPLHPEINRVVGDFTNTLLVAVLKSDGTFAERAAAIQRQLWQDLEHRQFGGVRVLRELMKTQGGVAASAPIVVTSLLGQPPRRDVANFGREVHAVSQTPQVTLDFQVREIEGRLQFNWDTLDAFFPPGMLDDMFGAYCALLDALDEPAGWEIEQFELVPAAQLAQRAQINSTRAPVSQALLHELLVDQARAHPDLPAVITAERSLTFAELARRARQVARELRARGVAPNQLVAIVMNRGWEQYVAVYGVLMAGAAYLPIDATLPEERLAFLLEDGQVSVALTQGHLNQQLRWPSGISRLCVDVDFEQVSDAPVDSVQGASDLAYVIYTSGSTGKPKGAMVTHAAVTNLLNDFKERLALGHGDRGIALSALHFDLSVFDVFSLTFGMAQVIPEPNVLPDVDHWVDLVTRERVTFWSSVPALADMLVSRAERTGQSFPSVRVIVLCGDFIPVSLPDRLRRAASNANLWSAGGPTETVVWSIQYRIGEVSPTWTSIPYGKPTRNQRYHVLDKRLRSRPVWAPGDIYCESHVGLARGYFRDEELTNQRFITLPGGGRAHASGDVGRYLPDGNIEILGRSDFQVKINGRRIELGEVETALAKQPGIRAGAVVVSKGHHDSKRLIGFVVAEKGLAEPPSSRSLLDALSRELPAYMVPSRLLFLDSLPLSSNAKVDRLKLSALAETAAENAESGYVAPRSAVEMLLADLFTEVLGVAQVGALDNFFELGGDSISATRLNARIEDALGVRLPLVTLFTRPTVEQVGESIAGHLGSDLDALFERAGFPALEPGMNGELATN